MTLSRTVKCPTCGAAVGKLCRGRQHSHLERHVLANRKKRAADRRKGPSTIERACREAFMRGRIYGVRNGLAAIAPAVEDAHIAHAIRIAKGRA